MICRLIKQENICIFEEQLSEHDAALFAAAEVANPFEHLILREQEPSEKTANLPLFLCWTQRPNLINNCVILVESCKLLVVVPKMEVVPNLQLP